LLNRQLDLKFFQKQIGSDIVKSIRKITFCGNDGDPIYCRDLVEIIRWLKSVNQNINLTLITNGSYKEPAWWKNLAEVLDHNDEIHWSIDGWDQSSNEQYRRNSDWSTIIEGIDTFVSHNRTTYCVWDTIAFRFNETNLEAIRILAQSKGMDQWQLTKSSKFGRFYPETFGAEDSLEPYDKNLVASDTRFERHLEQLSNKTRPGLEMIRLFIDRRQTLIEENKYSGICLIGNKGVFLNSQGEFYPCCWTANRYDHNKIWIERAKNRFNLKLRTFLEIINDDFWSQDFLQFDSHECNKRCSKQLLVNKKHTMLW
jgi:MoaA/NifB/PqqE/SkfB family radical SAM enzyme